MKNLLNKRTHATLLALLVSVAASNVSAQPDVDNTKMQERMFERISKKLDLSEDQILQAEQLREQAGPERAALRQELKEKRAELKEQSKAESYDAVAIESLAAELGELQARSVVARAQSAHDFQQILSEEQRAQMAELKGKRGKRGKFNNRRGNNRSEGMRSRANRQDG